MLGYSVTKSIQIEGAIFLGVQRVTPHYKVTLAGWGYRLIFRIRNLYNALN
jgi:hypothetical protein